MKPDNAIHKLFVEGPSDGAVINKLILLRLKVDLAKPRSHQIVEVPVDWGFNRALRLFESALVARRPSRNQYGTAIEAKILAATSPAADAFVAWFAWLFGD